MRKVLILFSAVMIFVFAHLYQKVKIMVLAYQVQNNKVLLDNLAEEKSDLLFNFYKEANYININKKLSEKGIKLEYPREYVYISSAKANGKKSPRGENMLAKIFKFGSAVEARAEK